MVKVLKNAAAGKIGMFRKGCKTSKSISPVKMQDALAAAANSKNLLCLISRHDVIISFGKKKTAFHSILSIASSLSASFKKYLSNFCLNITSINSCKAGSDIANLQLSRAASKARALIEGAINAAVISALVARTKKLFCFIQYFVKRFLGQPTFCHFNSKFIQVLPKVIFRIFKKFFAYSHTHFVVYFFSFFQRCTPPCFGKPVIHFQHNSFHKRLFKVLFKYKINNAGCNAGFPVIVQYSLNI